MSGLDCQTPRGQGHISPVSLDPAQQDSRHRWALRRDFRWRKQGSTESIVSTQETTSWDRLWLQQTSCHTGSPDTFFLSGEARGESSCFWDDGNNDDDNNNNTLWWHCFNRVDSSDPQNDLINWDYHHYPVLQMRLPSHREAMPCVQTSDWGHLALDTSAYPPRCTDSQSELKMESEGLMTGLLSHTLMGPWPLSHLNKWLRRGKWVLNQLYSVKPSHLSKHWFTPVPLPPPVLSSVSQTCSACSYWGFETAVPPPEMLFPRPLPQGVLLMM